MSQSYAHTGGHWMPCPRKDERAWRLAIVIRDGFKCAYCRIGLDNAEPKFVTLDHLDPISQGGTNQPEGLVAACRPCNSARKALDWREFAGRANARRIERLIRRPINVVLAQAFLDGNI